MLLVPTWDGPPGMMSAGAAGPHPPPPDPDRVLLHLADTLLDPVAGLAGEAVGDVRDRTAGVAARVAAASAADEAAAAATCGRVACPAPNPGPHPGRSSPCRPRPGLARPFKRPVRGCGSGGHARRGHAGHAGRLARRAGCLGDGRRGRGRRAGSDQLRAAGLHHCVCPLPGAGRGRPGLPDQAGCEGGGGCLGAGRAPGGRCPAGRRQGRRGQAPQGLLRPGAGHRPAGGRGDRRCGCPAVPGGGRQAAGQRVAAPQKEQGGQGWQLRRWDRVGRVSAGPTWRSAGHDRHGRPCFRRGPHSGAFFWVPAACVARFSSSAPVRSKRAPKPAWRTGGATKHSPPHHSPFPLPPFPPSRTGARPTWRPSSSTCRTPTADRPSPTRRERVPSC